MLKSFALAAGAATCALALSACQDQASQGGGARDYISAVGSSTVYPFTTLIAGRLGAGRRDSCGCFGTWSSRPLSWRDLVRNGILTALGVLTALG